MSTLPSASPSEPSLPAPGLRGHLLAAGVAFGGGVLATVGAFIQEARTGFPGAVLLPFVVAPIVEEAIKPAGIYVLLVRWPQLLRGRVHTALLAALAGLAFGLAESTLYVFGYFRGLGPEYVFFRYTVPVAMHAIASFLVGLGLTPRLIASMKGEAPFLQGSWPFFLAGSLLHALYNIAVVVLSGVYGWFSWE